MSAEQAAIIICFHGFSNLHSPHASLYLCHREINPLKPDLEALQLEELGVPAQER